MAGDDRDELEVEEEYSPALEEASEMEEWGLDTG